MTNWPTEGKRPRGFSLIELTIVLIVTALLAGSLLGGLRGQSRLAEEKRAEQQLQQGIESLYGFAIVHGRLPCPADPTIASEQADAGLENCPREHGVLPWRSLGLGETDPWGQRLGYFADAGYTALPVDGARAGFTLASSGRAYVRPDSDAGNNLADQIPAVLFSHGANGAAGYRRDGARNAGGSKDEAENADADLKFVAHTPDPQFDDLVVWIVPGILYNRMLAAGRLP